VGKGGLGKKKRITSIASKSVTRVWDNSGGRGCGMHTWEKKKRERRSRHEKTLLERKNKGRQKIKKRELDQKKGCRRAKSK